jgi:hypothetical protein
MARFTGVKRAESRGETARRGAGAIAQQCLTSRIKGSIGGLYYIVDQVVWKVTKQLKCNPIGLFFFETVTVGAT